MSAQRDGRGVNRLGRQRCPDFHLQRQHRTREKFSQAGLTFPQIRLRPSDELVGHTVAEVECELIVETLKDQCGSRTASAKLLGISLRTLRNKIYEYSARGKIVPKHWTTEVHRC